MNTFNKMLAKEAFDKISRYVSRLQNYIDNYEEEDVDYTIDHIRILTDLITLETNLLEQFTDKSCIKGKLKTN